MAKKKPKLGDAVLNVKRGRSHNLIAAWDDCPIVAPEVLREWLREVCDAANESCRSIHADLERFQQSAEAASMLVNSGDFVNLAKRVMPLLDDKQDPLVSVAFTSGLRLGMAFEKLSSIADGRYTEKWLKQEARQRGASTTNEAHAELREQYQVEVNRLMKSEGLSYTAACTKAAPSFGVNERTIRRNTVNPAPRNRGRAR